MIRMEQNIDCLGRDTEVCGDPLFWFPMRVTYSRELKVKAELNRLSSKKNYKIRSSSLVPRLSTLAFRLSSLVFRPSPLPLAS